MITLQDAEFLRGTTVRYQWQFSPWEEPVYEPAIILGKTAKRIRILHLNAGVSKQDPDVVRLVKPESLSEYAS